MLHLIGKAALAVVAAYLFLSIISAVRMYCVHSRYVHVEFGGNKWKRFGRWAPKRRRLLRSMRRATIGAAIVLVVVSVLDVCRY